MMPTPLVPEQGDTYARRYSDSLIDWSTFWDAEFQVAEWCVEPVLPQGRAVAIYSRAGGGKSLFILEILVRMATGQRTLDQRPTKPLRVMYLDLEMTEGDLYERLEDMGYGPHTDLSNLFYYMLPNLPPLDTAAGGEAVSALAKEHRADVVVIDTTSRVISGKENDSDTLLAFYRYSGRPLKEMGCTVVRLDHAGKDVERGQRGTSAKNDDVDLVWELRPRDGGLALVARKRRQTWIPETVDIVRREGPLRHELAAPGANWPAGTHACAEALDRLGAPLDLTSTAATKLLRDAGEPTRRTVVLAALRYRKGDSEDAGTGGNRPGTDVGNRREPNPEPVGNWWEPVGTASGTDFSANGNRNPEPLGTTFGNRSGTGGNPPRAEWEPQHITSDVLGSRPIRCQQCGDPVEGKPGPSGMCDACTAEQFNAQAHAAFESSFDWAEGADGREVGE